MTEKRVREKFMCKSEWMDIETAPRDGKMILVWGKPTDLNIGGDVFVSYKKEGAHTANWDSIDEAFCVSGASWYGPFIYPTHWMPLPPPPEK